MLLASAALLVAAAPAFAAESVSILWPIHGQEVAAEGVPVRVDVRGLTAGETYRARVNGELVSEFVAPSPKMTPDFGIEMLPPHGVAALATDLDADGHGGYAYPGWADDSMRLFRPVAVELVHVRTDGSTRSVARDRVLVRDFRQLSTLTHATPALVSLEAELNDALSIQLSAGAIETHLGALALEQRPHTGVTPLEDQVEVLLGARGRPISELDGTYCTPVSNLDVVSPWDEPIVRAWRTVLHTAATAACTNAGLSCGVYRRNTDFCARPVGPARLTDLALPGPEGMWVEAGTDHLQVQWVPEVGTAGAVTQRFETWLEWNPDLVPEEVIDLALSTVTDDRVTLDLAFPAGHHDCVDMALPVADVGFGENVAVSPGTDARRTDVRTAGGLQVRSGATLVPEDLCAEPFLDAPPRTGTGGTMTDLSSGVGTAVRSVLADAWTTGWPGDSELHLLLEDALHFSNIGLRSEGPFALDLVHRTIDERRDGLPFPGHHRLEDHYGLRWTTASTARPLVPVIGSPMEVLAIRSPTPWWFGDWTTGHWAGDHAPVPGTPFDASIALPLFVLNQALAAAATEGGLDRTLAPSALTPTALGTCVGASSGCAVPLASTGTGLSAWIPKLGELGDTPLTVSIRHTLPPTVNLLANELIESNDTWDFLGEESLPRLLLHVGQVQVVFTDDAGTEVLVVDTDVFDPTLEVALGTSDGWLQASVAHGEWTAETHSTTLSDVPVRATLLTAMSGLMGGVVIPDVLSVIEGVAVPEVADLPGGSGRDQTEVGVVRTRDQLWWFLELH